LLQALGHIWHHYYPIGERGNVPFHLGVLAMELHNHRAATDYFQHSLLLHGEDVSTCLRLAICYDRLGERDAADKFADQALALDPESEFARHLRILLDCGTQSS
jgi:Flp pilus assembly protein TadD